MYSLRENVQQQDVANHEETHFTYKTFLLGYWKPSVFYTGENIYRVYV